MMCDNRARLQAVVRATVGAFGVAMVVKIEEDARVRGPQRHGRIRAVGGQVFAVKFDHWLLLIVHRVLRMHCKGSILKHKAAVLAAKGAGPCPAEFLIAR